MADRETLQAYADNAEDYASRFASDKPDRHLQAFIDSLPTSAQVLDLGCGPGQAAAHMKAAGLQVDAWDASPELAAIGKEKFDLNIDLRTFDTLSSEAQYDGIHANFSLLHAPRSEMPTHLGNIARALKHKGVFHLGLKTGTGERRDRLGRFYTYYSEDELTGLLTAAGFAVLTRETGAEAGLEGSVEPWIVIKAIKDE